MEVADFGSEACSGGGGCKGNSGDRSECNSWGDVYLHDAVKEEKKDRSLTGQPRCSLAVSGPERMSRQDPLPLNESLEAVEGPGVGVQDDLGQTGDHEAQVGASLVSQHDGGLLSLEKGSSIYNFTLRAEREKEREREREREKEILNLEICL